MTNAEMLDHAIALHAQWKQRLDGAIQTGTSTFKPEEVRHDDRCELGQWLRSLPAADRAGPRCQGALTHHAAFHQEAARVLDLATHGRRDEAKQCLAFGGSFMRISSELVMALADWRDEIKAKAKP